MTADMNEVVLTDEHRRAIAETLVGREVDLELVYRRLEELLNCYQLLEQYRSQRPPRQAREYLQHKHEQISDVIIWLRGDRDELLDIIKQHPTAANYDEVMEIVDEWSTELAVLEKLQRRIDSNIEFRDRQCHAFIKNSHPLRNKLYIDVLRIWKNAVGGELTFQQPREDCGPPFGPLIDFFVAALRPILGGKTPNPSGIATIIKRVKRGNLISKPTSYPLELIHYQSIPAASKKSTRRASRRLRNL
jgi:hypothetical protein